MDKEHPGLKKRLYGAMERGEVDGFSDREDRPKQQKEEK